MSSLPSTLGSHEIKINTTTSNLAEIVEIL